MHTLAILIDAGDDANKIYESLGPELQAVPSERSRIGLTLSGNTLKLFIEAEDVVSLRAAINTWLRLVRIAEEMMNVRGMT